MNRALLGTCLLQMFLGGCATPPPVTGCCCATSPAVTGEYRYLGDGVATVTQDGDKIHILLTWTPAGRGPHYEVNAILKGSTIEGRWYSHYANKGWYYFNGEVSPSGSMIDFAKTEDPIESNMNRVRLIKK